MQNRAVVDTNGDAGGLFFFNYSLFFVMFASEYGEALLLQQQSPTCTLTTQLSPTKKKKEKHL